MKIPFIKMHGLGNDFIVIDFTKQAFSIMNSDFRDFSKKVCKRRFGIGADQLLLLYPSQVADFKMRIFNADGSEVEMCGNGIRCIAKYIWDMKLSQKNILDIETLGGIMKPERVDDLVRVDMGEPIFEPERIPVNIQKAEGRKQKAEEKFSDRIIDYPLKIDDKDFKITCVSMGNPHTIISVDNVTEFPVTHYGPMIENHPIFPKWTNVEFVEIQNSSEISMRVWERGAGETLACGTGASAAAVASSVKGLTEKNVIVHLLGGDLSIEWAGDNHVYMTGPAVKVFEGIIEY